MRTHFLIVFLLAITMAGSSFMVLESAGYYAMFYSQNQTFIAWGAAILSEVFQHTLIIIPGETAIQNKIFKSLALVIFFLTVAAAGYKIYKPVLNSLEQNEKETRLARILEQEITDNREDRNNFLSTNNRQKTNAAISVNARRESSKELKALLKKDNPRETKSLTTFEIIHLFLLRVAIQTAALACAWKIGSIYRHGTGSKEQKLRKIVKKWKAKHLRSEQGFVGIVQYSDGSFLSVTKNQRKPYKTYNGAVRFFNGTRFDGKIPIEPTEVTI